MGSRKGFTFSKSIRFTKHIEHPHRHGTVFQLIEFHVSTQVIMKGWRQFGTDVHLIQQRAEHTGNHMFTAQRKGRGNLMKFTMLHDFKRGPHKIIGWSRSNIGGQRAIDSIQFDAIQKMINRPRVTRHIFHRLHIHLEVTHIPHGPGG